MPLTCRRAMPLTSPRRCYASRMMRHALFMREMPLILQDMPYDIYDIIFMLRHHIR